MRWRSTHPPLVLAAVLAGQGLEEVTVYRRPVCAVMSTGSELIPAGQPPAPGKIYDSNAVSLSAWLERLGADCEILPTTEDHPEQIAEKLRQALEENDFLEIDEETGEIIEKYDSSGNPIEPKVIAITDIPAIFSLAFIILPNIN